MTDVQPPGVDEVRKAAYRVADAVRAVEDAIAYTPADAEGWDDLRWAAQRLGAVLALAPEPDDVKSGKWISRPRSAPVILPDGGPKGGYRRAERERLLAAGWRRLDLPQTSRCWIPPGCDGTQRAERQTLTAALAALDAEQGQPQPQGAG
ncbi:hypothetical protein [Micromonospora chersina]|uniref:hypothetical protein n=1 Tax=Micromonospora chersina TaxID=47854 RepID=UPI00370FE48C